MENKKYFVVSDIHSFYDELMVALSTAGFDVNNPNHILVSCGDLLDRGKQPLECLKFVLSLPSSRRILIRGNHEDLLEMCFKRKKFERHDVHNGTMTTIYRLAGQDTDDGFWFGNISDNVIIEKAQNNAMLKEYLASLVDYAELEEYIFVHGWIPCNTDDCNQYYSNDVHYEYKSNWRESNKNDWDYARWINGMDAHNQGVKENGKTIVCGHWHTSWGHSKLEKKPLTDFSPYIKDGIVAIDGCVVLSHTINCLVLDIG